ncbi:MAG: hypothetical protein ACREVI_05770 [Steroidobacteraceae bacterium]
MKIDLTDGTISFIGDEIKRNQGKGEFLGSRMGSTAKIALVNEDWTHLDVRPEDGLAGTLLFKGDKLDRVFLLMLIPSDDSDQWSEELELQRKAKHDAWLRAKLGQPPYEYAWGTVTSDYDPKGCVSEIIVSYAK